MSRQREFLLRAASELGLRVEPDPIIELPDGRRVQAWVRFLDLGNPRGYFVLDADLPSALIKELLFKYAVPASYFGEAPPEEEFDLETYKEMFRDWGWTGETSRPEWMDEVSPPK